MFTQAEIEDQGVEKGAERERKDISRVEAGKSGAC